ncbi:biotin carboxyl carrier domain-containing protein [Saccharopolyspora aridisoli]|uniref:Biotin carboxyl carrier domain-containing protein n=1 Tax=Saccharopolyspora aridisoli TaxID=2530385 RepID=A0A4R4ULI1_9PSEU|nr:biotin/lipoyl-containing protein [Saccharopolyspora aridisoli]TDC89293.1 biotin carboxyl carrier domain-containing protein [Saccharopolyspora aridisoli]
MTPTPERAEPVRPHYRRPGPDAPDYVGTGQSVTAEDTVGLVEVIKSFHPVLAGAAGTVKEVVTEGESMVDAGQVLMVIEVDG